MKENHVHNIDFLDNTLPDKCANLIIADPPYFEVKGDFDFIWKTFEDYLRDVERWAIECKRLLSDNGTLFWYGDKSKIAYSQIILDKYFNLENSLVWRKKDSMQYQYYSPDLARTFNTHNERILMYSNEWEINGLKEIYGNPECFITIKKYLQNQKKESGLSNKDFNYMFSEYTNKEGCKDRSVIEHYWGINQWVFPTEEIYNNILQKTGYFKKPYDELKNQYESEKLRLSEKVSEYEQQRRYFHNPLKYEEVLEFSQESHVTRKYDHDTKKPEKLTRALIRTCSRKGNTLIVPFAGSGTECAMGVKEGLTIYGFDIESKYCEMSNKRVKEILKNPELF